MSPRAPSGYRPQLRRKALRLAAWQTAACYSVHSGGSVVFSDTDIVLVDLDRPWVISDELVVSKCCWTPYAGRRVVGSVDATILRGQVVYEARSRAGPGNGRVCSPMA